MLNLIKTNLRNAGLTTLLLLVVATVVWAASGTAPIVATNGVISCPTCSTAAGTLTSNAVILGGGSKAVTALAPEAGGAKKYLQNLSSGAPTWEIIALADLASFSSANFATAVTGETGTGAVVFGTGPTIDGVTGTGTWNLTGATVNFASGVIDAITEIATALKSGGAAGDLLVTTATGGPVTGECVEWGANGNIVASGGACGGTTPNPRLVISSQTPVTVLAATPVYMSLGGAIYTSEADARSPIPSTAVFTNISCIAKTGTTNAITATLGENGCTTASDFTTKLANVMSATANTVTADNGGTTTVTGGECGIIKFTAGTDAAETDITCTLEITG